ncbi:unnamed protein product [Meganyctiphanes norvegica]|uniref:Uncharacterized protein n=1 Tax=Meganyctiphanes norvegica TaxID=48144 RepID=A0AAV2SK41_MEGNR
MKKVDEIIPILMGESCTENIQIIPELYKLVYYKKVVTLSNTVIQKRLQECLLPLSSNFLHAIREVHLLFVIKGKRKCLILKMNTLIIIAMKTKKMKETISFSQLSLLIVNIS